MRSRACLFIYVVLTVLVVFGITEKAASLPQEHPASADANVVNPPSFPYVAQITGNDVYVRSGPGTNYYRCSKLNKTSSVTVVSTQFSWSCIIPPAGSFSWISKQYVKVDRDNPENGTVTGDNVRVYAGSEYIKPIHSTRVQLKLSTGDRVRLLGEEVGDYYKIAPPAGAYLWVSTKYTRPIGSVAEVPPTVEQEPQAEPNVAALVPTKTSVEAEKLQEYYKLQKRIEDERGKDVYQQNYKDIKKALLAIANNKQAGKAARYAKFQINRIERFELALAAAKEVRLQEKQLARIREQIEQDRAKKLAELPDIGRFAVTGILQKSSIYSTEPQLVCYRITDDSGKIVCYACPTGPAMNANLEKLLGQKVGLVGTIEPHPETAGALVRFTEIVKLSD